MDRSRLNVATLVVAQSLAVIFTITNSTSSALVGQILATDKALATLPIALQFAASMMTAVPASVLMQRRGRRFGFLVGAGAGVMSGVVAAIAIILGSFPLFCCAGLLAGVANSFALFYRFAAADTSEPAFRPKAISLVMAGGIFAALFGPEIAKASRDLMPLHLFAGTFAVVAVLQLLNGLVLWTLRIPKPQTTSFRAGRPLSVIARQPAFKAAVLGAVIAYAVMALLMTATPLAMAACGHAFEDSAFVIQWHVLGMYGPSFVTGHIIRALGVKRVMLMGVVILATAVVVNVTGPSVTHFWIGLLMVGIGWNFLFVGATTLLTETHTAEERAKVQALNDLLVFSTVAVAGFAAGALEFSIGWEAVNLGVVPLIAIAAGTLLWLRRRPVLASA